MQIPSNFGFRESILQNDHYIFGDGQLAPKIIMPNGQGWANYLPLDDVQSNPYFESMNCTSYGTLHALATLGKAKFGLQFQTSLSERYTGIMASTTPQGNDPQKVIETIRTISGVVPEVYLPFGPGVQTWSNYYNPNPVPYALYAMGVHWLKKYKVGHDWVWLPTDSQAIIQQKIIDALQYSTLGISVLAWNQHTDGLYYSDAPGQNHWVELYGRVDGQYWMIFDSYDQTHKKLAWNFNFGQAKRYSLDSNLGGEVLGDEPEQIYLPYLGYLAKNFINQILK